MSPIRRKPVDDRCTWLMPADSRILPSARCVGDASHEEGHVIADPHRDAVTFWQILDERARLAKVAVHADLRDGSQLDDTDCRAMWVMMESMKHAT